MKNKRVELADQAHTFVIPFKNGILNHWKNQVLKFSAFFQTHTKKLYERSEKKTLLEFLR